MDGHGDYWDGETSPTGESADMELAILHGQGPPELAGHGAPPARRSRPHGDPRPPPARACTRTSRPSASASHAEVLQLDTPAIREAGPAVAAEQAIERAGREPWLHIDLDALDEEALPAVSYPLADGLDWDELEALMAALLEPGVCGVSVADLNSDKDPDGVYAKRVAELLTSALRSDPD